MPLNLPGLQDDLEALFANPSVDPAVAGYYLYQGTASHNYTQQINEGNVTQVTLAGLTPGLTYYFALSAYDTIGLESILSTEISYTPPLSPPGHGATPG